MVIEKRVRGGVVVVRPLEENMDARVAPVFREDLLGLIEEGHRAVALDLSGIEFMDTAILGVIIAGYKALSGKGVLAVFGMHGVTETVFKLTRMDKVFRIFDTEDEAVTALSEGQPGGS